MTGMAIRTGTYLLAMAFVLPAQGALSQTSSLQGAWIEEGLSCSSVYTAGRNAIGFKRPPNAFVPAFVISGKRVTTPLASCRILDVRSNGDRQIMNLHCTTSISTNTARAVLAPAPDGGLFRYLAMDSDVAAKYQRCKTEDLRGTDGKGASRREAPRKAEALLLIKPMANAD